MNLNVSRSKVEKDPLMHSLIKGLDDNSSALGLTTSNAYIDFPVYKDLNQDVLEAQLLLISKQHGVLLFFVSDETDLDALISQQDSLLRHQQELFTILFTKLLRNSELRENSISLKFSINGIIYVPNLRSKVTDQFGSGTIVCQSFEALKAYLQKSIREIGDHTYYEIISTVEGANGIIKSKKRIVNSSQRKGIAVCNLENEIASFDQYQKQVFSNTPEGLSRIRGLAGSGKTVVLAIKVAVLHLRYPEARIAFTYYTKSLQQHIKNLIYRFYRQFDDQDPNWDKIDILHAWGSQTAPGVYYKACLANSVEPLNYLDARRRGGDVFDNACEDFLSKVKSSNKIYDYILIDEGQDFPGSFIKLCVEISTTGNIIWAYDELQTIFRTNVPTTAELFGFNEDGSPKISLASDIILFKCYRNPREILVVAHAIGFGIYSDKIAQMIESKDYWRDIGYTIESGELRSNERVRIIRPPENSLRSISASFSIREMIRYERFSNNREEVIAAAGLIHQDIQGGMLPEDILVISVDDRYANSYLNMMQEVLESHYKIRSNNIHADKYSIKEFQKDGFVTLSTIHKAKGNEAYSVYILGVDALYYLTPSIRDRNILFTALTRSKAWVYLSGLGDHAAKCFSEIDKAIRNFPYLDFIYPSPEDLRIMRRDIVDRSIRKSRYEKTLDELLDEFTPEQIKEYIEQRTIGKHETL